MEAQIGRGGDAGLPRRHDPDLGALATFTVDSDGRITSWSLTATRLFGPVPAGRHICDVLLTGPGHQQLVSHALGETAAGRIWSATVAGGRLGAGRFAIRWEPLTGLGGGAIVVAQPASPGPRATWLSEAAARIGTTLDLTETAREVAEVAVPSFAEAAAIFGRETLFAADELATPRLGSGAVVRRLAASVYGQAAAVTDDMLRPGEVLVFGAGSPSARAMTTGEPVLSDHLDAETAQRLARRPEATKIAAGYRSFLAMPLIARGAVVGVATFGRSPASPAFSPDDIAVAGELASRAAVCIDNARLYHRERRTALALQAGLLPGRPDVPAGLEVASEYLSVGASVVGGDWHDIVALPGGRAALIVGDAMGHGPEAAAVMVQLRTAAHTLAGLDLPADEILHRLDEMAAGMAEPFATCVYTVVDPPAGAMVAARAGHLPPVLVLPGGATRVLDLPAGLPLGLAAGEFETTEAPLPPGATLALYTDGLVESRSLPVDEGMAALRAALGTALADPATPLDEACATIIRKLEHHEDDVTLVLARVRP
ncbi:MAG TPA: SpoIIE family protein phosphatase [Streptosporangiaceae bacterium]|nr:SpoIIE family protein phosphatase [Streptosporangiaceae bacterium]